MFAVFLDVAATTRICSILVRHIYILTFGFYLHIQAGSMHMYDLALWYVSTGLIA